MLASKYLNQEKKDIRTKSLTDVIRVQIQAQTSQTVFKKSEHRQYKINCGNDAIKSSKILFVNQPIVDKNGNSIALGIDKESLYKALAFSFIVGDHDLSTGNFMLIAENPNSLAKIGRIDFGHAFNDLIKNWYSDHSPSLQSKGSILDALNRDKVNGETNKFRRYFPRSHPR